MKTKPTLFKQIFSLTLCVALVNPTLYAVDANPNGALGARPYGVGNAYIGSNGDGFSPFFNPAGVAAAEQPEVNFSYGAPTVRTNERDQHLGSFSLIQPRSETRPPWGLFLIHESTSRVRQENMIGLNLSRSVGTVLFGGVNLKYGIDSLDSGPNSDETFFSVDFGLLFKVHPQMSFGLVGRDLNRPRAFADRDSKKPATYGVGLSLLPFDSTTLFVDGVQVEGGNGMEARGGIEQRLLSDKLALRTGANEDSFSLGVGLQTSAENPVQARLDYAYSYPYILSRNNRQHVVSLGFRWGGTAAPIEEIEDDSEDDRSDDVTRSLAGPSDQEKKKEDDPLRGWRRHPSITEKIRTLKRKSDLVVGPGDVLFVEVKNHPELTANVKVDAFGFGNFPFIGEIRVKKLGVGEIRDRLSEIYQGFVSNPEVRVQVTQFNSRVFYVFGEVKNPGKFLMGANKITVREALVQSELPTERAAAWRAFVIRQTEAGPMYRHVNLRKILYRADLDNNIVLQNGDVLMVPIGILDYVATYVGRLVGPIVGLSFGVFRGGDDD